MKLSEAQDIILRGLKPTGYMVSFEWVEDGILRSDHFPDKRSGEDLIPEEESAWHLARQFASQTIGKCVNIYVIGSDFSPVPNYREWMIENRK